MAPNKNQKCALTSKRTQDEELQAQFKTKRTSISKAYKKKANKKVVASEDIINNKENLSGLTFCNTVRGTNKAQKMCKKLKSSSKDVQTNVVQKIATKPSNKSYKDKFVKDSNIKISTNEQGNFENNVAVLNTTNKSDKNKADSNIKISANRRGKEENNVAINIKTKSDTDTSCDSDLKKFEAEKNIRTSRSRIKFVPKSQVSAVKQQEKLLKMFKDRQILEKKSDVKFGNSMYKNSSRSIHQSFGKTKTQAKATKAKRTRDSPQDQLKKRIKLEVSPNTSKTKEILSHDTKIYCICRKPETNKKVEKKMIGCDFCAEWYHGSCLDLNEEDIKDLTRFGFKWKCPKCELSDSKQKNSTESSNKDQINKNRSRDFTLKMKKIDIECYKCSKCEKIFVGTKSLINHINTTHMHSCKYCKEKFALAKCVKEHEKMHTGGQSHFCNYCKKTINNSNYKKMMYIGEHSCNFCHKKFAQAIHAKEHERIHAVKKFDDKECDIKKCDKDIEYTKEQFKTLTNFWLI